MKCVCVSVYESVCGKLGECKYTQFLLKGHLTILLGAKQLKICGNKLVKLSSSNSLSSQCQEWTLW